MRKKKRKKPKWGSSASKTSGCLFYAFSESKIAFHLLITVSNVPREGDWSCEVCRVETRTTPRFSTNEFLRDGGVRLACRLFILSAARQQANFMPQPFFSLPTWAKGSAASTSSRRIIHHPNKDTCRWAAPAFGDGGQVVFFCFFFNRCRHISSSRLTQHITHMAASIQNRNRWKFCLWTRAVLNTDFVNAVQH